jgi:hypothetical protein
LNFENQYIEVEPKLRLKYLEEDEEYSEENQALTKTYARSGILEDEGNISGAVGIFEN